MKELNQILKHEQEKSGQIAKAKQDAQKEIDNKRQELLARLDNDNLLSEKDQQEILGYKEKKVKEIKELSDRALDSGLVELKQKEQDNLEKAVNYVVDQITKQS